MPSSKECEGMTSPASVSANIPHRIRQYLFRSALSNSDILITISNRIRQELFTDITRMLIMYIVKAFGLMWHRGVLAISSSINRWKIFFLFIKYLTRHNTVVHQSSFHFRSKPFNYLRKMIHSYFMYI